MSGLDVISAIFGIYIWLFHNPIIGIVIYLLPIIIANIRHHKNAGMITIIGILFGWIFLLWFILVIWSAFGEQSESEEQTASNQMTEEEIIAYQKAKERETEAKNRFMNLYK